jgi:hypothetical protein
MRPPLLPVLIALSFFLPDCGGSGPRTSVETPQPAARTIPAVVRDTSVKVDQAMAEAAAPAEIDTLLDDYASFLAGVKPVKYYTRLADARAWNEYAAQVRKDWLNVRNEKLLKIRSWANGDEALARTYGTLFYPFAGADFLFANAYWPGIDTTIMVGLEPAGSPLELYAMRDENVISFLKKMNASLSYVNRTGYFITKKMRASLYREDLNGTLPLMLFYLKRYGYLLSGMDFVTLDTAGTPVVRGPGTGRKYSGVRIRYTDSARTAHKTLFYFSFNLCDSYAKTHREFYRFIAARGRMAGFLKAASYLMHNASGFCTIRKTILENCGTVLQDDSGIPWKEFNNGLWHTRLYGNYTRIIPIFRRYFQRSLAEAYSARPVKLRLPFKIGYNTSIGETNLLVAVRM